jgi:quercetin dioxygenase-like cupin family protein
VFQPGDTIENKITGERLVFLQTASETGGELVVVETFVRPGGFVAAAHVHPHQEERFHVLGGTLRVRVGKEVIDLTAGDSAVVPPGTPHRFWNAGAGEAHFVCEVRPALHFEALVETMFALAADGKTNRKGMPNILRLAVVARAYSDTIRLPFPPALAQRAGLAAGAPVGRLLGYRPTYAQQLPVAPPRSWVTAHDS